MQKILRNFVMSFVVLLWVGCASTPVPSTNSAESSSGPMDVLAEQVRSQQKEIQRLSAAVEVLRHQGQDTSGEKEEGQVPVSSASKKDPMALYFEAWQLLQNKQYDVSSRKLKTFIRQYPTHVYVDRAQFLLLKNSYQKGEYARFVDVARDFEVKYPYSFKVPELLYYRGVAYQRLGNQDYAQAHFERVVTLHNGSPFAERATQALVQLTAPSTPESDIN